MKIWITLAMFFTASAAQAANCNAPETQREMNLCANEAWQAADGDLNRAWRMAMRKARSQDEYLAAGLTPSHEMLRGAQRVWIRYRDKACAAEATLARGGSMEPLLQLSCLERLTRQRTEDLRYFGEVN